MALAMHDFPQNPAIVARPSARPSDADQYLMLTAKGAAWTTDPQAATAFDSMKEAMRAAMRLPSALRAFGLPLRSEIGAHALN
jgi:hypothetical protein